MMALDTEIIIFFILTDDTNFRFICKLGKHAGSIV